MTPPYLGDPLMAGSTSDVSVADGMKPPLVAASGAAGNPKKIWVAWIDEVHLFQAVSRLPALAE